MPGSGFVREFRGFEMRGLTFFIIGVAVLFSGFVFSRENAPAFSLVFDFESGDLTQEGWQIVEGANSRPIGSRETEFHSEQEPYAKHGKYYLTTLEQAGHPGPTDDTNCIIESPIFTIRGKEIRFLVGGGQRPKTYVALCVLDDDGSDREVLKATGQNSQGLAEIVWDVSPFLGKDAFFRLVDQETGSWAHLRADFFRVDGTVDPAKTEQHFAALAQRRAEAERLRFLDELPAIRAAIADSDQKDVLESKLSTFVEKAKAGETVSGDFAKLKREILGSNPLLLQSPILYITRAQYLPDHHNTATMFQTGEINIGNFRGGGALKVWDPKSETTRTLLALPEGIVRDPCIGFDAKTALLSIRKNGRDDYHIYELSVDPDRPTITIDGETEVEFEKIAGLRQLTFGSGVSDIDPLYLPDGDILFSSTREPKYCMCNRHIMCNLFVMNADGSNIRQIGHSTLFEGHASLLPDGRILYDRWEYVDRNFGDAQGAWVANPDGTNHAIFWGNNTASPGGVIDCRILPNSDSLFLSTLTSCHDRPWGAIGLIDRRRGIDGKAAVLQTWPREAVDLVDRGNYDSFIGLVQKFEDPCPLSESFFLASGTVGRGEETGIWLLDRFGNQTLLHEDAPGCFDPMPLAPSAPPPAIASRIDLADPNGYFYVTNVYEGFGMHKVVPGSAKTLRVVESPEKRFWTGPWWDNGTGTQAPGMAWDDFNNKRILGTVDVEKDGSVYFAVPADRFVYFQLLDANGMMIQSMRSGTMVRPGETNGCFGCHENRLETPPKPTTLPLAMTKPPQELRPWYGKERLFSYLEEVQPVFDKYCVECHDFGQPAADSLVLAGDRNLLFNASYQQLRGKGYVQVTGAGPHYKLEPLTWGSSRSKLASVLLNGHPDPATEKRCRELKLALNRETDRESFDRVMTWIDLNAPYYPTYGSAYRENRFGRSPLNEQQLTRLQQLAGTDPLWSVSFDRPEKSPALAKLAKDSAAYREALGLIEQGKANLEKQPRGENPDFCPVDPIEIEQQHKYDRLRQQQREVQKAILSGQQIYENDR